MSQMPEGTAYFGESMVKAGDKFDLLGLINPEDQERITRAIKIARNNSRVVLATTHAHDSYERLETEAPYIRTMAHACVDAGADIFFAAGPHLLRGIEIYQGRPIFYSLGNFIMHPLAQEIPASSWKALGLPENSIDPSDLMSKIPYAGKKKYWQSVVPVVTLDRGTDLDGGPGEIVAIELHPILLGFGEPGWRRGTPELVTGKEATEILDLVAKLSEANGTSIRIRGGVGHVEL
jgi:poly-gamma-glutamate synthesis protein (capsule biosynthesis protein)